ncbi:MAG: hypothetical protein U5O16_36170 [Rhodococcus sp. (in: high G+C Gram-positive bacteria)]|uniref:hypothetical protein n=1 Tax=Rhodococcus sp. TaxID=1831 RepID=UPI002AD6348B|nr:hypothetical protein [Rhodococcus sp. (in: high G+C Gram-positive bacteria)]
MFSGFKPKSELFYALFTSTAQYLEFGAKTLAELASPQADTDSIAERMVGFEHECDSHKARSCSEP